MILASSGFGERGGGGIFGGGGLRIIQGPL